MYPQIFNLTLLCVTKEIEFVLADYAEYPYQIAFSIPCLRQKLIAYVLNRIPNRHIVIENIKELPKDSYFPQCPLEERIKIENLIRGGMIEILKDNAEMLNNQRDSHLEQISIE